MKRFLMIRLCSDLHLNHTNILEYDPLRWVKYKTIEEMNEGIIHEIESTVKPEDDFIFLWDLAFWPRKSAEEYVQRIPGKKKRILWNHDGREYTNLRKHFFSVQRNLYMDYRWYRIRLNHFPPVTQRVNYKVMPDILYIHWHTHKPNWSCNLFDISYNWWKLLYNLDDIIDYAKENNSCKAVRNLSE